MNIRDISTDQVIIWQWRFISINATIVFTWLVMALMVVGSWLITRKLSTETQLSRWQNILEILVIGIREQIRDVSQQEPDRYLPFIGTLFLFIAMSNLLGIVPGYRSPVASLSTTVALAICVFIAVPLFGISQKGLIGYFRHYVQPTVFMLPFHIMGELSRTLALAVRLFGNVMSEAKIIAILLVIVPFFLPIIMHVLGLLIGLIQAYIFAILAMVYIASATRAYSEKEQANENMSKGGS